MPMQISTTSPMQAPTKELATPQTMLKRFGHVDHPALHHHRYHAFVFVVLTNATIEQESAIIGTLLASGYRRSEIVLHYLALPAIVAS